MADIRFDLSGTNLKVRSKSIPASDVKVGDWIYLSYVSCTTFERVESIVTEGGYIRLLDSTLSGSAYSPGWLVCVLVFPIELEVRE